MIYMESIILIDEPGLAEYHGPKRFRRELAPRRGRNRAHAFSDPPDPHAARLNTRPGGLPPKRTKKHPGAGGRSSRFDGASNRTNPRGSVILSPVSRGIPPNGFNDCCPTLADPVFDNSIRTCS